MPVKFFFVLARHRLVLVNRGTVFNLFSRQVDEEHFPFGIKMTQGLSGNQHPTSREPAPGVGHQIAHGPILIIEIEVLDVPDLAVGRAKLLSVSLLNAL